MARYISRAQKKPKKSKVIIFLNIVIGILVAFIIMGLIGFVGSMGDNYYTREFGDTMTSYSIDDGDYADLLNEYYSDYGNLGYVNKGYEDAAALAEYAEAAFRYNAYQQAGDSERASRQKALMDQAAAGVGIYEPELSKTDERLGRE